MRVQEHKGIEKLFKEIEMGVIFSSHSLPLTNKFIVWYLKNETERNFSGRYN